MSEDGPIVSDEEFSLRHNEQVERRGGNALFVWAVILSVTVIGAHFILTVSSGSPTGFVTAEAETISTINVLADAFFVLFITVLVGVLGYLGVSRKAQ